MWYAGTQVGLRTSEDTWDVHWMPALPTALMDDPFTTLLSYHQTAAIVPHCAGKACACITMPSRMVLKLKKMGGGTLWCILIILWHVSCPLDSIMKCIKRNWQLTKMFLIMVFICSFMIPSTRVAWPLFVWTSKQCLFQKPCNRWELLPW